MSYIHDALEKWHGVADCTGDFFRIYAYFFDDGPIEYHSEDRGPSVTHLDYHGQTWVSIRKKVYRIAPEFMHEVISNV